MLKQDGIVKGPLVHLWSVSPPGIKAHILKEAEAAPLSPILLVLLQRAVLKSCGQRQGKSPERRGGDCTGAPPRLDPAVRGPGLSGLQSLRSGAEL